MYLGNGIDVSCRCYSIVRYGFREVVVLRVFISGEMGSF